MRIKVIERILPLDQVYHILLKFFKPKSSMYIRSCHNESNLLIILLNSKRVYYIIRASKDEEFHRTYLSILALNSKYLNKNKIGDNSNDTIISKLFKLLKDQNKNGLDYHLTKIPGIKPKDQTKRIKFKNIEKRIITKIFTILSNKFNYFDNLLKFPFSNTQIDGSWIHWERIYNPFIRKIEKRINSMNNANIKTFRHYDFALKADLFPRIFELISIEKIQSDKLFKEEDYPLLRTERKITFFKEDDSVDESHMYNLRITFLYCNKKFKSLKLMELLKLMNEIKNYSEKLQSRIKKCNNINPQMIIISFFRYENKILAYLRKHIYHETNYIIPIFVLPPSENSVWHNFKTYNGLSDSEKQTKENLKKLINIGHKSYSSFNFKVSKARNAKDQYKELKEVEKIAIDDYELMKTWSKILRINTNNKNQNQSYIKNEIPESSMTSINKKLKI